MTCLDSSFLCNDPFSFINRLVLHRKFTEALSWELLLISAGNPMALSQILQTLQYLNHIECGLKQVYTKSQPIVEGFRMWFQYTFICCWYVASQKFQWWFEFLRGCIVQCSMISLMSHVQEYKTQQTSFLKYRAYQSARASITKYNRLGSLNRNLFSHSAGVQKCKIKMLAGLIYREASLFGLKTATFTLYLHMASSLCMSRDRENL